MLQLRSHSHLSLALRISSRLEWCLPAVAACSQLRTLSCIQRSPSSSNCYSSHPRSFATEINRNGGNYQRSNSRSSSRSAATTDSRTNSTNSSTTSTASPSTTSSNQLTTTRRDAHPRLSESALAARLASRTPAALIKRHHQALAVQKDIPQALGKLYDSFDKKVLTPAEKTSLQVSLTELMTNATEYQLRAVERDDALRASLASPLAVRKMPNMPARSDSALIWKSKELREMEAVFEMIEAKSFPRTIHHTQMLLALGREGFLADAEKMFQDMVASAGDEVPYKDGHFVPDSITCNGMIGMYDTVLRRFPHTQLQKDEILEKARGIFRYMNQHRLKKDIITYTSMINLLVNQIQQSPIVTKRNALLKESLELFEFMQTPQGGELKPNRRTFSVLIQAFAANNDHESMKLMLDNMMRTHSLFPNLAMMNGILKATAYGCGRNVPVTTDPNQKPKCNVQPIQDVIKLMSQLHIQPTEHSVASVIKGLAQAGQVQAAKDLHDHLKDGSLGTVQPSRLTYSALLSVLINDHNQSMASILATYNEAITTPGIFKSSSKRRGTMIDLRHLGNHPELYPIALTKQLFTFLDQYMELVDEAQLEANISSKISSKRNSPGFKALNKIIPDRGWLIITGRHRGDQDANFKDGQVLHEGVDFKGDFIQLGSNPALNEDGSDGLVDEFPDEADYSDFDQSGKLKKEAASKPKGHSPSPRQASRLNTLNAITSSNSYGQVAEKFLLAQTPSITTVITQQFASPRPKDYYEQKEQEKIAEEELKMEEAEKAKIDDPLLAFGSPLPKSARPSQTAASGKTGVSTHRKGGAPELPKKSDLNEGMLIVKPPVLFFWLRCHAYVVQWHKTRQAAIAQGATDLPAIVPPPSFLEHHQQAGWWRRLAESIELQHGLAALQTSMEYKQQREQEERRAERAKQKRAFQQGFRGTRRDGTIVEPEMKPMKAEPAVSTPNWNVRRSPTKAKA